MASNKKKQRFHFLDGIRGIASILIVIHHSLTAAISKFFISKNLAFAGYSIEYFTQSGVVLFFVLSGIVLLRPYLRGQRKFDSKDYFLRRIKRIYPPYFFALIFGFIVIFLIKHEPHTFYSNIWRWCDTSFPGFAKQLFIVQFYPTSTYNLAWWSLQIEVLFYFFVPLVIAFFSIKNEFSYSRILIVFLSTFLIFFCFQIFLDAHYPYIYSRRKLYLNANRFIDYPISFLLGVYLAKFDFRKSAGKIAIFFGLVIIICSTLWVVRHDGMYTPAVNQGYSFLYAGFIVLLFNNENLQRIFDRPIMVWIGERSYSLFLVHFSVFYLTDYCCSLFWADRSLAYGVVSRLVGLPLALFIAMLLFQFVERRQAKGLVTEKIFWPWNVNKIKPGVLSEKLLHQTSSEDNQA